MAPKICLEGSHHLSKVRNLPISASGCHTSFVFHSSESSLQARNYFCFGQRNGSLFSRNRLLMVFRSNVVARAYKKSRNKLVKDGSRFTDRKSEAEKILLEEKNAVLETTSVDRTSSNNKNDSVDSESNVKNDSLLLTRDVVLQACILTSALLAGGGVFLRQASHVCFTQGWLKADAAAEISFGLESWHLEVILGLVAVVTAFRYTLLKVWPDFAESSEAANKQILSSLEPLDYLFVSLLPGIGEELLFRGALMPLCGLNWQSALATGAVFGVLHLGNGRKYSFAIWATFVGFFYGLAALSSSSIIVPMAAHTLNNLLGAILWRWESKLAGTPDDRDQNLY